MLTDVVWRSATVGSCRCPGAERHSGGDGTCAVFIDRGWPLLHCFHDSCAESVRTLNGELLRAAPDGVRQERKWTNAEKEEWRCNRHVEYKARVELLPQLSALEPMTADDWLTLSPVPVPDSPLEQWRLLLRSLFDPADLIWCGELWMSGKPEYTQTFRTAAEWQRTEYGPLGEQMSLCTFNRRTGYDRKKGTVYFEGFERAKERIQRHKYTLVESDTVDRERFSNVQRWLAKQNGFVLRAIIDTGGKSFHAWYDCIRYNPEVRRMAAMLRGLSADRQAVAHITARSVGITRSNAEGCPVGEQRLLYLNPL